MKIFLSFIAFNILISGILKSQPTTPCDPAIDNEQHQLELCFKYSNLLGYDIEYISNPDLYECIYHWIGTPYRYSGESKKGVDCSNFICQLFKTSYNINLEGNANDLYKASKKLKKKELQEGDLVFFKIRRNRISHVGIYIGKNKFVHASTKLGVTISDLNEPYYSKYFYSGGRIKT